MADYVSAPLETEIIGNIISYIFFSTLPGIVVACTAFTKVIVVFSLLKHAIGIQQTISSYVVVMLSLCTSMIVMQPVIQSTQEIVEAYKRGEINFVTFSYIVSTPLKEFMVRNVDMEKYQSIFTISGVEKIEEIENLPLQSITLAFMISEINKAFQIGFFITLPFLVIDLVVSSVLAALGMIMMPPHTVSLPIKVIFFVMIDGWQVIIKSIVSGYI